MYFEMLLEFPGFILELLTLSDSTFHHLLGLLALIALLRLCVPLHKIMTKELSRRNKVSDLAEEYRCTEFDVFVKAHTFYYGSAEPDKIKWDFITYLNNWPDNYILPFYIRNFLEEFERDSSDSGHDSTKNTGSNVSEKLPNRSII